MNLITAALAIGLTLSCLPLIYLYVLFIASLRKPPVVEPSTTTRFTVAIPAHNEAQVIERTIKSLRAVDYPLEMVDIYIVADNCTDETASIARRMGVRVFEHNSPERIGKGAALSWLFNQIFSTSSDLDTLVIFDADTLVSPDFFKVMSARFQSGAQIVQGNHIIRNPRVGWFPTLTWAMFLIDNRCQNLGRVNLGLSAKNMGDSICFKSDILNLLGWGEGLTDDYEFRHKLLLKGFRISYEPRAIGKGDAASSWKEARIQRARWLRGTYQASRKSAWQMMKEGIKRRDLALLDGAVQAYLPSYSTLTLIIGFFAFIAWWNYTSIPGWLPVSLTAALFLVIIYPFFALAVERASWIAFLVILTGPVYILWRTELAFSSRFLKKDPGWVKTRRRTENSEPPDRHG